MAASELRRSPAPSAGDPAPARDLIDFHLRWSEFRPLALRALDRSPLSPAEYRTLRALVDLADRLHQDDLRPSV